MSSQEMFSVFPVKGIIPADDDFSTAFDFSWWLLPARDIARFVATFENNGTGLGGNLEYIQTVTKADALLFVKRWLDINALPIQINREYEHASNLISAINYCILHNLNSLAQSYDRDEFLRILPTPIWIPKFQEHITPMVVIDRQRIRVSTNFQSINWPAFGDRGEIITNADIRQMLSTSPQYVKDLLKPARRRNSVQNAILSLGKSFDTVTVGRFVSQALSSIDILFGENESIRWTDMKRACNALLGGIYTENIENLFKIRHKLIHRNIEPEDDTVHNIALSLAVSIIPAFQNSVADLGSPDATLKAAWAADRLMSIRNETNGRRIDNAIGAFFDPPLLNGWAQQWLSKPIQIVSKSQ